MLADGSLGLAEQPGQLFLFQNKSSVNIAYLSGASGK